MSYLRHILKHGLYGALLVGVIFSYGGGSTLIQSLAWATMFADELSKEASVEEALKNTFDGDEPCELCDAAKRVQQVAQDEPAPNGNENTPVKLVTKKLSDGFINVGIRVPKVMVSQCDRGWNSKSKSWDQWFLDDVAVPPPEAV